MKPHLQTTIWTLLRGGATQREIERITAEFDKPVYGARPYVASWPFDFLLDAQYAGTQSWIRRTPGVALVSLDGRNPVLFPRRP